MRQVPQNLMDSSSPNSSTQYIVVGNGRLARQLLYYFSYLKTPVHHWYRSQNIAKPNFKFYQRVLLAINDSSIEPFILEHQLGRENCIHFSGSLQTRYAHQLHPLMTFNNQPLSREQWQAVPFVNAKNDAHLTDLIPEFNNPFFQIDESALPLYHAMCVLAGSGTALLWQKMFQVFSDSLQLPKEILIPFMNQLVKNIQQNSNDSLTGPWVREDTITIAKNIHAMSDHDLKVLYISLLKTFKHQPKNQQGSTYEVRA